MSVELLERPKILIVDDDPAAVKIIQKTLEMQDYDVQSETSGVSALGRIKSWEPDLVLLDINMPGIDGLETLKAIRELPKYVSTVFVSGKSNTVDIISGLDRGADGYICKPFNVLELMARVRTQLRINSLQSDLEKANVRLQELVDIDDLTGLYNMRSLYDKLTNEMARGFRYNRSVSVVMMDMDHFKSVNDTNDHLFGSYVLAEVGKIINKHIRQIDIGARYGGDEFLMVLTETNAEGVITFCKRLSNAIRSEKFDNGDSSMHLTCSLGFATTDPNADGLISARDLVKKADNALYAAKHSGRNCICYHDLAKGSEEAVKVELESAKKIS